MQLQRASQHWGLALHGEVLSCCSGACWLSKVHIPSSGGLGLGKRGKLCSAVANSGCASAV
jgi:hypothetical protein